MVRDFGKILAVDLETHETHTIQIEPENVKKYLGGAGLAAYLYSELVQDDIEPLDPASPLIAMTGPLTGVPALMSGRHGFAGRSPLTGFWGEASVGGNWGKEFRKCGLDGMVITGKADQPKYIFLENEKVAIKDAGHLWGKDCFEVDDLLKLECGSKTQVCSIGPAGENQVLFSGIFTDGSHARTAARCGLGALMGSKRLKAIVVKGDHELRVHDKDALKKSVRTLGKPLTERLKGMSEFGTPGLVVPSEALGNIPIKNWRQGEWTKQAAEIGGQVLNEKYVKKQYRCANCPVGCGRTVSSQIDGTLTETGGPEYETLGMVGSNCMIDNLPAIMELNEHINRLGMDSIDAGAVIALTMELYEKGLITTQDLDGLELTWGNVNAAKSLLTKVSIREGFGDVLANGIKRASEAIGQTALECSVDVNNMSLPAHDPRAYVSLALTYATANQGPSHTSSFSMWFERAFAFPEIGIDEVMDRFDPKGKALSVMKMQNVMELWENLALCKFTFIGGVKLKDISIWLKAVLNIDFTIDDLIEIGERSFTLKRKLNVRWGKTRQKDSLPLRILTHRKKDSETKDHLPPFNMMLADYYEHRGWSEDGIPQKEVLQRLKID